MVDAGVRSLLDNPDNPELRLERWFKDIKAAASGAPSTRPSANTWASDMSGLRWGRVEYRHAPAVAACGRAG